MITIIQKRFIFLSLNRIIHSFDSVFKQIVKAPGGGGGATRVRLCYLCLNKKTREKRCFLRQARLRAYSRKGREGVKISLK